MTKTYAIIRPATQDDGSIAGIIYPLILAYHKASYESVCGYSLGHDVPFYDTLEAAKAKCYRPYAIIELEIEGNEVIGIGKIHEFNEHKTLMKKSELGENLFEPVEVDVSKERMVITSDISANAFEALTKHYQLRHFKNRDKSSKEAQICKELGEEFIKQQPPGARDAFDNRIPPAAGMAAGLALGGLIVTAVTDLHPALSTILKAAAAVTIPMSIYTLFYVAKKQEEQKEYVRNQFFKRVNEDQPEQTAAAKRPRKHAP